MENAQNKGMSKGCLIGLIVVAAIVVLILIGLATCWFYKDDLAKMAAGTLVNGLKAELVTREYDGVDTVHFNLAADAFLQRLEAEDPLNFEAYSIFMPFSTRSSFISRNWRNSDCLRKKNSRCLKKTA